MNNFKQIIHSIVSEIFVLCLSILLPFFLLVLRRFGSRGRYIQTFRVYSIVMPTSVPLGFFLRILRRLISKRSMHAQISLTHLIITMRLWPWLTHKRIIKRRSILWHEVFHYFETRGWVTGNAFPTATGLVRRLELNGIKPVGVKLIAVFPVI